MAGTNKKPLYNISKAVVLSKSLNEFIGIIKKQLGFIIDTSNFYVALYNKKTDRINLTFFPDKKDNSKSFPANNTITGYVIKSKKPLLAKIDDMLALEKSGEIEIPGTLLKVWMGVPLISNNKVIGAVAVQNYNDENAYNTDDLEVLEFVSQQICIFIERKKDKHDLKLALEKATESERLKSAFLTIMSHELRTPLNSIIGFSEIINKASPIDEIIRFVKIISENGYNLLNVIENLFDISLIETGKIKICKEKQCIQSIMNDVKQIINIEQIRTNKQDINICFNNQGTEDFPIYTDIVKLKQVLINLIRNALKYTNKGFIEYGYSKNNEQKKSTINFYVRDTGIGIPENKLDIIFDIFRQADDSYTRLYNGSGLGLSISKKLVELIGGKMWVESKERKGTTFYFTLPYSLPKHPGKTENRRISL